ncbi:hypothetical protein GGF32_006930, partial [Allomyces javanicus]
MIGIEPANEDGAPGLPANNSSGSDSDSVTDDDFSASDYMETSDAEDNSDEDDPFDLDYQVSEVGKNNDDDLFDLDLDSEDSEDGEEDEHADNGEEDLFEGEIFDLPQADRDVTVVEPLHNVEILPMYNDNVLAVAYEAAANDLVTIDECQGESGGLKTEHFANRVE